MGTEVRIGIATGLVIVGVAGVYFFYGSNRDAADLKIVTSGSAIAPPQIPAGRNKTPDATTAAARPSGISPAHANSPTRPPDASATRTVHATNPRESVANTNRPSVPTKALASNLPTPDRSITTSVGGSSSAMPATSLQAGPAGSSWVTPITASTGSQVGANRPASPPTVGPSTSNDHSARTLESINDATPLRTSPSSSLREATQRNLESASVDAPQSNSAPIASPLSTDSSRNTTKTPIAIESSASSGSRPAGSGSITLPPSLQPSGPKPANNQPNQATMVSNAQTPADRGASAPPIASGANAPRTTGQTGPGVINTSGASTTNDNGSTTPVKPTAGNIAAPAIPALHIITAGDTFSTISSKYYGSTKEVARIAAANPNLDPRRLKIGDSVILPARKESNGPAAAPASEARIPARAAAMPSGPTTAATVARPAVATTSVPSTGSVAKPETVATSRTYTVREGDTLYGIAEQVLGKGARWKELLEKNRATLKNDPKRLKPGMILNVP
ncbi:MAG: LysM peptidoglycan-binding domain-containing protein [Phycisphaerae bacterium]|nr:LysM peptidoglycan-binding domain-containing protein [Phycisphaerae bacterium]